MCIASIKTATFDLKAIMGLNEALLVWVYLKGEWCLHQLDTSWQVIPEQRLLYRHFDVNKADCLDLEEELICQPGGKALRVGKRKGEVVASPLKKVQKVDGSQMHTQSAKSQMAWEDSSCSPLSCASQALTTHAQDLQRFSSYPPSPSPVTTAQTSNTSMASSTSNASMGSSTSNISSVPASSKENAIVLSSKRRWPSK
ncbi:hypothetical protein JB92DRAFT_3122468 [Gautieria morchelliformis]|nr:hypothetical protein JB92DRAFT_3122468 [Gautieria morchelliformis]